MVGKPNLPSDAESRGDVHGSATTTPGLTALDEEREASLADEGGASGAVMEAEEWPDEPPLASHEASCHLHPEHERGRQVLACIATSAAIAGFVLGLSVRR